MFRECNLGLHVWAHCLTRVAAVRRQPICQENDAQIRELAEKVGRIKSVGFGVLRVRQALTLE